MRTYIYEVKFKKYPGETMVFLATGFDECLKKARAWNKRKRYGKEIISIEVYGTVDA